MGREQNSLSVRSRQETNIKSSCLLEMLQGCIPVCLSTLILCFEESPPPPPPPNFYQFDPVFPLQMQNPALLQIDPFWGTDTSQGQKFNGIA